MKHRRLRRTLVGGCVAAAPIVSSGLACDRTPSPKNKNTPVAASDEASKPSDSIDGPNSNAPQAPSATEVPVKSGDSTPGPSPAITSPSAEFVPPEVDLSNVPDFDREQILKIREMVIDAPGSADRVAELGMHYCVRGFDEAATLCFKRATALMPRVMRFQYLLAISYDEKTQRQEAIDAFREALALEGKYAATYVNLGRLLIEKDALEARSMFEKAIELDPTDSIAHWGLGRCLLIDGKEDEALALFKKAVELQPTYADAHLEISKILKNRGQNEESGEHARLASEGRKGLVKNDPIRFDLSTRLRSEVDIAREAIEAARQGKKVQAIEFLERTMRKGYRGAAIHRALGEVLMMTGRYDDALVQFRQALKISPRSTTTKILISTVQIEVGELDQAEATLSALAKEEPVKHEVINRLGVIDVKRGKLIEAEQKFRRALDADPGNGSYRFALAQVLALQGRDSDALEAANRTLEILPDDASVHLLRGRLLLNMKRTKDATSSLQKAIEINPLLEQAYVILAGAQRDEKNHAESIRSLEIGNRQLPDSMVIANDLAYSLAACPNESLRDPQRAISLARRICDATFQQDVNFLDTLATAYAAAREYAKAAEAITKAIERAEILMGEPSTIKALKARLAEYKSRVSG